MYERGDGTLTYREYIGDIIPAGPIGSLRRFAVAVDYRITPGGVTIGVLESSTGCSSCPDTGALGDWSIYR